MKNKAILGLIGLGAIITIYLIFEDYGKKHIEETGPLPIEVKQPKMLYGFVVDSMIVTVDRIKRNENLSEILNRHNVPYQKVVELAHASKDVFDVRKMVVSKKYTMICYPDSLHTAKVMVYEPNAYEYIVYNLEDSVSVQRFEKEIVYIEKEFSGTIEKSLAVSIDKRDGSPALTNAMVDVLAWQVEFYRLQKGDKYKIIYNDKQVDSVSIGIDKIKAVYMEHEGNDYYGFFFDQGTGIDYFDEEGNSVRKAFLKYPLEFTRISSRFSGNRYHPVQKRWKAHKGTDFAAPKGTPIRSVGDGVVTHAEYSKFNGNYVKIRHNSTYSTQYLHMSRIGKGIRRGVKVKQSQVIGYVGATGLAAGNHLCYRFWKNGVQVDALKENIPPAEPISKENIEKYNVVRDSFKVQLDNMKYSILQADTVGTTQP